MGKGSLNFFGSDWTTGRAVVRACAQNEAKPQPKPPRLVLPSSSEGFVPLVVPASLRFRSPLNQRSVIATVGRDFDGR